jgi:hypothetical protein
MELACQVIGLVAATRSGRGGSLYGRGALDVAFWLRHGLVPARPVRWAPRRRDSHTPQFTQLSLYLLFFFSRIQSFLGRSGWFLCSLITKKFQHAFRWMQS